MLGVLLYHWYLAYICTLKYYGVYGSEWHHVTHQSQESVLRPMLTHFHKYVNRLSTFYFFRYNPNNLTSLETYVDVQAKENAYDLEANLVVLKQYQFNQNHDIKVISQILLKALTNFPHTDFILCKCLLNEQLVSI